MLRKLLDVEIQLLNLLKKTIWNDGIVDLQEIDWESLSKMAKEQGVASFVYDGARQMGISIPDEIKQQLKNHITASMFQNERLLSVQNSVIRSFEQAHISAAVLKGSSIARYYPQPELRALGDIDILVAKNNVCAARELLLKDGFEECDYENGFHFGFSKKGVTIELHEQVTAFPDTPGGQEAQKIANGFLDNIDVGSICGYEFPVLSRANQAMSLLLHMVRHMFENGIGLRQMCDWMVFVFAEGSYFEDEIYPILRRCGMLEFAEIATQTCVAYLGLDSSCCRWCGDINNQACALFIDAVFHGGNLGSASVDTMGSLFTDEKSMGEKASLLMSFIRKMNRVVYKSFPFVERVKLLLPIFWIYLPIRYLFRSIIGLRPKKSLKKTIGTAKKQRELFDELHLFEI